MPKEIYFCAIQSPTKLEQSTSISLNILGHLNYCIITQLAILEYNKLLITLKSLLQTELYMPILIDIS